MKRFYLLTCLFYVIVFFTAKDIQAGIWIEDFKANHLDSWTKREHQRERVTWSTKSGRLDVQTKAFCNDQLNLDGKLPLITNYTLAFTKFPIEVDQLRVKMSGFRTNNAHIGIFIGLQPENVLVNPLGSTYQFASHLIGGPLNFPINNPHIELKLKEIEIVFEQGLFELYSQGEEIVDFQDDNFHIITYIGIVLFIRDCRFEANAVVDNFMISGPSIPNGGSWGVQSKDKTTVVWGGLKRR